MRPINIKFLYLPILLLILISPSETILAAGTDDEETRYYDIEIVIFKNNKVPKGTEFILPVSSPRIDEDILDLSSPRSIKAAHKKSFEIIPDDELRLIDAVKKIVDSPRYSLLVHTAWRQPGLDKDQALPVWIKGGRIFGNEFTSIDNYTALLEMSTNNTDQQLANTSENLPALTGPMPATETNLYELEGKITIVLSRYLHTFADLVLRKPRVEIAAELDNNGENQFLSEEIPDAKILNNHPLKEQRRMRSNRLHYLDNPEFSMLILITPYEVPEITEDTTQIIDDTLDLLPGATIQ
ncbi:MAG: hypothetical protein E2O57_05175 [Gammaproteobacteria bacterium]|nr:MAG: hypothetical protein E2O57_05175 [Gammaproteobacteria bacterium]